MELRNCHFCGKELFPGDITKDHAVATALGGVDARWNWVISCKNCNAKKSDEWLGKWCNCNKCRKSMRRHWEMFGICETKNAQTKRNKK